MTHNCLRDPSDSVIWVSSSTIHFERREGQIFPHRNRVIASVFCLNRQFWLTRTTVDVTHIQWCVFPQWYVFPPAQSVLNAKGKSMCTLAPCRSTVSRQSVDCRSTVGWLRVGRPIGRLSTDRGLKYTWAGKSPPLFALWRRNLAIVSVFVLIVNNPVSNCIPIDTAHTELTYLQGYVLPQLYVFPAGRSFETQEWRNLTTLPARRHRILAIGCVFCLNSVRSPGPN